MYIIYLYNYSLIRCMVLKICLISQNYLTDILKPYLELIWFVSSSHSLKRFDLNFVSLKTSYKVYKSVPIQKITLSSKPGRTLLATKVPLIYKFSFSAIFPFFNFSCSLYSCLDVKDTRVIGLLFI